MKKYIIIFVAIILLVLPLMSCNSVSNLLPKALASDTQAVVSQVEANSQDVFAEIQHNIDLVANLKTQVEQDKMNGKPLSIDDAIKDITTVCNSYEKLAGQHEAITKSLLQKVSLIQDMEKRVSTEVATLQQKRTDYAKQLALVSDSNPDIVKSRKAALTQTLSYIDQQIALWQSFNNIENDIANEMNNVARSIDSFLSVIDSSAIVFREGLNLLLLQRDINQALSLFNQDLPKIQQLTSDMQQSWKNLDALIQALTSVSSVEITS